MATSWLSLRVELLAGGRLGELWPRPGRLFVVGPQHTFAQLAEAINVAFARWDPNHLYEFTLADGRRIGPLDEDAEEPLLDAATTTVLAEVGDDFRYLFDFGDEWLHRCTAVEEVDPVEELGVRPPRPLAYFGWGDMPDQYSRRWADDEGEGEVPPRPVEGDPMLDPGWPHAVA